MVVQQDDPDWLRRCAARLQVRWPKVDARAIEAIARDLAQQPGPRSMDPEDAAMAWVRAAGANRQDSHARRRGAAA